MCDEAPGAFWKRSHGEVEEIFALHPFAQVDHDEMPSGTIFYVVEGEYRRNIGYVTGKWSKRL